MVGLCYTCSVSGRGEPEIPPESHTRPESRPRPGSVFEERQRFRQPWVVGLVVVIAVGAWVALVSSLVAGESGTSPWLTVVVVAAFGVGLPWLMYSLELHTVVDATGVSVRFRNGFGAHRFPVADMASATSVNYRPMRDFGGWGLRWGWGGSRAYNVSGDRGVEIVDTEGRRWVIGSQRPDELAVAVIGLGVPAASGQPGSGH